MTRARLSILVLAAACGATATSADDGMVVLSITGHERARVRGWCHVETPEGELRLNLDEEVPVERRWRGIYSRSHGSIEPSAADRCFSVASNRAAIQVSRKAALRVSPLGRTGVMMLSSASRSST